MSLRRANVSLVLSVIALQVMMTVPAHAADSVYTDLDLDRCKTVTSDDMGAVMTCGGYRSYQVHFAEGDLRQSVFYGPIRKDILEQGFESFEPFNRVNNRIEWRVDGTGRPYAAILRWFIENVGENGVPDEKSTGQVLVVSRVAQPNDRMGCVVGYVDALANPQANELARAVADKYAVGFACMEQEALWHGRRGEKAADATHVWPDAEAQQ